MNPQALPDTIPLTQAHLYLPQLHQAGITTPALPDAIPINEAHTYLPTIMQFGGQTTSQTASGGPSAPTPQAPTDRSAVANMILQKFSAAFGPDQAPAALEIAKMESGVNPLAANKTSSARGIWQFLSSTGKNYGLPPDASQATPEAQTDAAVKYIAARYGNPEKALAFHKSAGWY